MATATLSDLRGLKPGSLHYILTAPKNKFLYKRRRSEVTPLFIYIFMYLSMYHCVPMYLCIYVCTMPRPRLQAPLGAWEPHHVYPFRVRAIYVSMYVYVGMHVYVCVFHCLRLLIKLYKMHKTRSLYTMPQPGQYGHCSQDQVKKFYLYKMPVLGFISTICHDTLRKYKSNPLFACLSRLSGWWGGEGGRVSVLYMEIC